MAIVFKHLYKSDSLIGTGAIKFRPYTVAEPLPQLATPQNVTANGTTVSWDEVENAKSYEIFADGVSIGTVDATPTPTLISFTIAGTSYQAEEGMTWAEWVESSYNTRGFHTVTNYVTIDGNRFITTSSTSADSAYLVVLTTKIIADSNYYLVFFGGGN